LVAVEKIESQVLPWRNFSAGSATAELHAERVQRDFR
jgi:hypothetical protein